MSEVEVSEDAATKGGVCKWYNKEKGFGFIEMPEGGLDIFIHANQLRKSGIERALVEGEKVKFVVSKGPKGQFATNISIIKD